MKKNSGNKYYSFHDYYVFNFNSFPFVSAMLPLLNFAKEQMKMYLGLSKNWHNALIIANLFSLFQHETCYQLYFKLFHLNTVLAVSLFCYKIREMWQEKTSKLISKPVHYIFVSVNKISKQNKTFIFVKDIYEYVLIIFMYIHANKDLLQGSDKV